MKKILNAFLVFAICMCTAFSFIACGDNIADNRDSRMVAIYGTYVAYAEENDITPLSYEEWLESVKGQNGKDGVDGKDGLSVKSVIVNEDGKLIITFTDNSTMDAGLVKGANGKDGVGISDMKIENGKLYVKYTDSNEYIEVGQVKGTDGKDGTTPTIEVSADGYWVIGGIKTEVKALASDGRDGVDGKDGVDGANGKDGRGVEKTEVVGTNLIIYYTDGTKDTHDLSDIIVDPNDKLTLVYSVLPDGTYGVMAGGMAKYNAVIEIPATYNDIAVTQILAEGFANLSAVQKVVLPDSIKTIGSKAFQNCIGLKEIVLPTNLERIEQYAFNGCSVLTSITIPGSVNFIGRYSFYSSGLTSAVFEVYSGWKLTPAVEMSYGSLSKLDGSANLNGYWVYTYTCSLNSSINAANALIAKASIELEKRYTGTGYGSGDVETEYKKEILYKSDWVRE